MKTAAEQRSNYATVFLSFAKRTKVANDLRLGQSERQAEEDMKRRTLMTPKMSPFKERIVR